MDNSNLADLKEELKKGGLRDEEASKCIEILKDIYIGMNIRDPGIRRQDFYKYSHEPIDTLIKQNYIEETGWYSHILYHTTKKGSEIGKTLVTKLIDQNKDKIVRFLSKQPQKVLNFVIQNHVIIKDYEKFSYAVYARDLSVLGRNDWVESFIKDDRIHRAWTSVLSQLEALGLCVRTWDYVSTRGGELREKNYVISPEVFAFLVEHCPKEDLNEEEYENCRVYDFLQKCYHYHDRTLDRFRDAYWDGLRDLRLEEEKVKGTIDKMEEMGITSEFRGLVSPDSPFSIKDKSRYSFWLEKTLKEPIIKSLLEPPKIKNNGRDMSKYFEYDVFICHASEDKETVVKELVEKLNGKGLKVWYDDFTLQLGDSLRRKIDDGLANSRYGVVVLSKKFFEKEWTKKELDGLVARENGRSKVILPIWHNVTKEQVQSFSPILADRKAVSTDKGVDHVVNDILKVVRQFTS